MTTLKKPLPAAINHFPEIMAPPSENERLDKMVKATDSQQILVLETLQSPLPANEKQNQMETSDDSDEQILNDVLGIEQKDQDWTEFARYVDYGAPVGYTVE